MTETWGLPVALDLFFAGLGAGAFCLSVLAGRKHGNGFEACSRSAAFLAPLSIAFGLAMLLLDLMYKSRFWLTLTVFNTDSPMSFGVWLLSLFAVVAVVHALLWLPRPLLSKAPVVGQWRADRVAALRRGLGLLGIPLALAVSVYTGVLLSVSSLPLWRNPVLPGLFCFSAMATGFAAGGLAGLRTGPPEATEAPVIWLCSGLRIILPLYLAFSLLFMLFARLNGSLGGLRALTAGGTGVLWWLGVIGVGILLPLAFVKGRGGMTRLRFSAALYALLAGGFLLRLVIVFAGQASL